MENPEIYTIRLISPTGFFIVETDGEKIPYFRSSGFVDSGKTLWDLGIENFTPTEIDGFKTIFAFLNSDLEAPPILSRDPLDNKYPESLSIISLVQNCRFLIRNTTHKVRETLEYIFCTELGLILKEMDEKESKWKLYRDKWVSTSKNIYPN